MLMARGNFQGIVIRLKIRNGQPAAKVLLKAEKRSETIWRTMVKH